MDHDLRAGNAQRVSNRILVRQIGPKHWNPGRRGLMTDRAGQFVIRREQVTQATAQQSARSGDQNTHEAP